MARCAFIVGGTGQIGRATALDLLSAGWEVTVSHRGSSPVPGVLLERGAKISVLDRNTPGALAATLGSGANLLIDAMWHSMRRMRASLRASNTASVTLWSSRLRAFIAMRSTARLTRPPQTGFPQLPDPIPETQPTVDPGPSTYSTRKIALERHLLDESTTSVTILRSGAIYGVDSRSPREWWFAKRMLDRRPAIPLAYLGRSQFHTTAATNISALIRVAAEKPSKRVLNIADPIASSVADIAACITQHLG